MAAEGVTVAVRVTAWPTADGLGDVVNIVAVGSRTTCIKVADVLRVSLASPPYDAVSELEPSGSVERVSVAVPAVNVPVPSVLVPL